MGITAAGHTVTSNHGRAKAIVEHEHHQLPDTHVVSSVDVEVVWQQDLQGKQDHCAFHRMLGRIKRDSQSERRPRDETTNSSIGA